ncbi:MAG: SCO family protein [bacterium]|nr:SCO family protein [bacterium]
MLKIAVLVLLIVLSGCAQASPIIITATPEIFNTPAPARMAEVDHLSSTPSFFASNLPTRTPEPTVPPLATPNPQGIAVYDPPVEIGDFMLMNQDEEMVHITDFAGGYVLLTFGYTHCPDVCPLTLAHYKRIKSLLGETAEQLTFIFISVDGARDTPERLKEYLGLFDPAFIGLSTDENDIMVDVAARYRAIYSVENSGGLLKDDYPVNHTAGIFLMNPAGEWSRFYVYGTEPNIIARDLSGLLTN